MDMVTCVARRTRSRTESFLNSILNKSKGIHVEDQSNSRRKRPSMRNARSPPPPKPKPKRRRSRAKEDDEIEFLGTTFPEGKRDDEHVEDDNVGSSSVISPSLDSNSPDDDRNWDFAVDDTNSRGEEERTSTLPDDDRVYVGTEVISPSLELKSPDRDKNCDFAMDDTNSRGEEEKTSTLPDDDDVVYVGTKSPCDFPVDDANLRGEEEKISTDPGISESDDVISLSYEEGEDLGTDSSVEASGEDRDFGDSDSDEDADSDSDSDSSDYMEEESSDCSYMESSESDFVNSEDDDEVGARDTPKVRKSPNGKVYTRRERETSPSKNNSDVFQLLAKSIWDRTKISGEDSCSGDETAEVESREEVEEVVRESSSEKRKPRSYHREKNHLNKSDLLGNSFCEEGESFDGREYPCGEQDTVNLRFGCEEPEPIEKTEEEKEIDSLWEDMALALKLEGLHSSTPAKNGDVPCIQGNHDFVLDEEIGLKCCHCSYVSVEIRDISPAMDKYRANFNDQKTCNDRKVDPLLNGLEFEASDPSSDVTSLDNTEGTVWEYIPGIKNTLYPHQQEGFEFIWKNLAGTTNFEELKSSEVKETGGCIISHAPGTGKTRLTIVFLQSYLERFPDSHPMVIAPASILLTWEEQFRKWNANIPFYNMNNLEFSGQESQSAVSLLKGNKNHRTNKRSVRMVKLYSWRNKKSILGISYSLYEKLAGNKIKGEMKEFKRMLLELPGLVVLDEGHTPRNQNSRIWKVLTEVKTEKRIILSGTPFQNNFKELSNVLCLARPAYTDEISSKLQHLSKWNQEGKKESFDEKESFGIKELRDMIAPFVHVHKGDILRESLPGLRDCVVLLNPPFLQKKILSRIDDSQSTFEHEHKLSAVSVHPSLYLHCTQTKKEQLCVGPRTLKKLEEVRLNSKEGVKTRFLIDFIRLSVTLKEKVLVFSQYIETLMLIRDQLSAVFGWTEGKEILLMYGKLYQKDRQQLINDFNNPDSEAKVLLASTKACSEGIHLVGASRVILLDVVWNPSVESQAISRAYRIGQKRVVYTYHLMVKDTSEWDKYCKQTKKHHISEMVFSNETDKLINNKVVSEDRILDEMVRHEKLNDMFHNIL